MIIVTACNEVVVRPVPNQPARPMADTAEKLTTRRVAKVPLSERNRQPMMRKMVRYMSGTRVRISFRAASVKALLSMTRPVRWISMSGWAAWIFAASRRAWAATSGTSVMLFWGSCRVTLTPVTRAVGNTRRPPSRGSRKASRLSFSKTPGGCARASDTRSATKRSSPSAWVC